MTPVAPTASFKDNLALLPSIDGIAQLDLLDASGTVVATIPSEAGKQGSLKVYNYLQLCFGRLDAAAAEHGLAIFAEHTPDARARPGAHPNIDRLIEIVGGAPALEIVAVAQ
ncbi:DUF2322 family protein [Novosphingobium subterraneum]|nr:DUF2322 family protein [Novosphingobium subterraneum]